MQPLWKTIWQFPHKLNINSPYVPAIPLLEIYREKLKHMSTEPCTQMFIAAVFIVAKPENNPNNLGNKETDCGTSV